MTDTDDRRDEQERPREAPAIEPGSVEQTVGRGRAWSTPFVLVGGVATIVWLAAGIVTLAALLVWWLT
jgi:hypothetical protein